VDLKLLRHVKCRGPHLQACPAFRSDCSRAVLDNQFRAEDVSALHAIAAKGMGAREKLGGPTILDINTVRGRKEGRDKGRPASRLTDPVKGGVEDGNMSCLTCLVLLFCSVLFCRGFCEIVLGW
jgi:hypothetical protein